MNRKNNCESKLVQTLTLGIVLIVPSLTLADNMPMPRPKDDNLMKNTTARHAAAAMVHFNEVDGEPIEIISSK